MSEEIKAPEPTLQQLEQATNQALYELGAAVHNAAIQTKAIEALKQKTERLALAQNTARAKAQEELSKKLQVLDGGASAPETK